MDLVSEHRSQRRFQDQLGGINGGDPGGRFFPEKKLVCCVKHTVDIFNREDLKHMGNQAFFLRKMKTWCKCMVIFEGILAHCSGKWYKVPWTMMCAWNYKDVPNPCQSKKKTLLDIHKEYFLCEDIPPSYFVWGLFHCYFFLQWGQR